MIGPKNRILGLLISLLVGAACSSAIDASPVKQSDWGLSTPQAFDLKIPSHFFKGQLAANPQQRTCHTQGMEIVGDELYISCCLYDPRRKIQRSFAAESLIIKAKLSDILEQKKPNWKLHKITEELPDAEQARVSHSILSRLPATLASFVQWLFPLDEVRHVLGHPSGLFYDEERKGIWVANAVYGRDTYTNLQLMDKESLKPVTGQTPIKLQKHLGFVATTPQSMLWSVNWGREANMVVIDPRTGVSSQPKRAIADNIEYQDCDQLDYNTVVCSGYYTHPETWYPHRSGVLHVYEQKGSNLDSFKMTFQGGLTWQPESEGPISSEFGRRSFVSIEQVGDIEMRDVNHYGDYESPLPLTNAGMAVSPDKRYIYFVPDDLPHGKLVRFELHHKQPHSISLGGS